MTSQHFPFFEAHICLPHTIHNLGTANCQGGAHSNPSMEITLSVRKTQKQMIYPPASEGVNVIYPGVFEQRLDIHGIFVFTNALPPGGMAMETHPKCVRVSIRTKTSLAVSARLGCVSIGCRIRSKRNHYVRYPVCSS